MSKLKNCTKYFDSWKCQLLCNKMSKVENSYNHSLKTILKQYHTNVNRAPMNKYSCMQILFSVHMNRFAYMQNLHICKLKFSLGLNQVQISRICIWCKFCMHVQIHSHGQICTGEYIFIDAYICTRMQICPCECTVISSFNDYSASNKLKTDTLKHQLLASVILCFYAFSTCTERVKLPIVNYQFQIIALATLNDENLFYFYDNLAHLGGEPHLYHVEFEDNLLTSEEVYSRLAFTNPKLRYIL